MEPALLPDQKANGGYFEPPAEVAARFVRAHHDACGADTRVRLPETVPARAVRRLRCSGCQQAFETAAATDVEPETSPAAAATTEAAGGRRFRLPALAKLSADFDPRNLNLKLPKVDPESRSWKLLSIPLAAVAVIAALILLQGDDPAPESQPISASQAGTDLPDSTTPADNAKAQGKPAKNNKLVRGSSYSLALPAGWRRIFTEPAGATFAAASADGGADATLWIDEDPKLDFPQFVDQSLKQLQALAGSAQIVDRVAAPTPRRPSSSSPPTPPRASPPMRSPCASPARIATTSRPASSPTPRPRPRTAPI